MAENPAQSPSKKWIEPVVAVLMALTTICTAWCSYESATWTRQSNRLMNESNALDRQAALLDVQHAGNEKLASSFLPSYECSSCLRPNELSFRILQNQTHS